MLFEGEGIPGPIDCPKMVDLILDRWPDVSAEEIERGFRTAIELGIARDAEEACR